MGAAFKCDMTGQLVEGVPCMAVEVDLSEHLVIVARVYRRDGLNRDQGQLSKEASAKIAAALETLVEKKAGAEKKG